jgi:hypothetical protein
MMAIYCASVLNWTEIMKNKNKMQKINKILIKMNYCIIIEKKKKTSLNKEKKSVAYPQLNFLWTWINPNDWK